MRFTVLSHGYDRFTGRYSTRLAVPFCDFAGVGPGMRVLDVGCGPGALTVELARRVGRDGGVVAVDPAEQFVETCRARVPEAEVRQAPAEDMLDVFWEAARSVVGPTAGEAESRLPFRTRAEQERLAERVGLGEIQTARLTVEAEYDDFDDFWAALDGAAAPAGAYYASLDDGRRARLREECDARLGHPRGPFTLAASAWAVRGVA